MSEKIMKLLKTTQGLAEKLDELCGRAMSLAHNAHEHLEYGDEGAKMLYQLILAMQKKGAKGDLVGDYKHADVAKFAKEIGEVKKRYMANAAEHGKIMAQADLMAKMLKSQDAEVGKLSKEKDIAKNPAAVKLLVETRKEIEGMGKTFNATFTPLNVSKAAILDITPKTKVDDLKAKLPGFFKVEIQKWEDGGAKFDAGKRAFRKNNFADNMKAAAKIAG